MAITDLDDIQLFGADSELNIISLTGAAPGNEHRIDLKGYAGGITVTIVSGAAAQKQVTFQASEDGETSWINTPTQALGAPSGNGVDLSIWTTNAKVVVPRRSRYLRMLRSGSDATGDIRVHYSKTSTALPSLAFIVSGPVADDAVGVGYPVLVGGNVFNAASTLTAGDRAYLGITTARQLVIKSFAPADLDWTFAGVELNTAAEAPIKASVLGFRNYLTGLQVQNTHATVATVVEIRDGVAGTVLWRGKLNPGMSVSPTFATPLRGTAGTALLAACITTGASVYVSAQGYMAQ